MSKPKDKFQPFVTYGTNPVDQARGTVTARIGTNIYGRLEEIRRRAECGQDAIVRRELLDLLRFFPKQKEG